MRTSRTTRTLRLVAIAAWALAATAVAQYVGPVGPGTDLGSDAYRIAGRFEPWGRVATPVWVIHGGAGRLRVFADIAADGAFAVTLPAIDDATPLGSRTCGAPGGPLVGVLAEIDLLTPLEGFTSPREIDRGLSVIGMAALADAAYAERIASPGSRRAAWLGSREAPTVAAGECNNLEPFELAAGWTAVTVEYGPSGGPHHYRVGLDADLRWHWWAFPEPDEAANGP